MGAHKNWEHRLLDTNIKVESMLTTNLMPRSMCLHFALEPVYTTTKPSSFGFAASAQMRTIRLSSRVNPEAVIHKVAVPFQVAINRKYLCFNESLSGLFSFESTLVVDESELRRDVGDTSFLSICDKSEVSLRITFLALASNACLGCNTYATGKAQRDNVLNTQLWIEMESRD